MIAARRARPTVLLVDPDADQREIGRALLEHAGFKVIPAASGEAALARIREEHVDLLVVEVALGDVDGFSLCQALKLNQETGHLPIVVTALRDIDRRMVAQSGCDVFIPKPWRVRDLVAEIRRLLAQAEPGAD